jgi:DNA-binding NtrC family response regulator
VTAPTDDKDESDVATRSENGEAAADAPKPIVLVVDDRPKSRELIGARLRDRGYPVVEAEDGVAGWDAFREHSPGAVITDMRMPRADGLELLERIRKQTNIPIFCITAYPDLDSGLAAMKRGAEYYYRWPQELDVMIDEVDEVLSKPQTTVDGQSADRAPSLSEIRAAGKSLTIEERKAAMQVALDETRGNVEKAAQLLGISRRSFYHWMDRYGVDRSG